MLAARFSGSGFRQPNAGTKTSKVPTRVALLLISDSVLIQIVANNFIAVTRVATSSCSALISVLCVVY